MARTLDNTLDLMMKYEVGDTSHEETVALFQHLVDTGLAWDLQGSYGRAARDMIAAGDIKALADSKEEVR